MIFVFIYHIESQKCQVKFALFPQPIKPIQPIKLIKQIQQLITFVLDFFTFQSYVIKYANRRNPLYQRPEKDQSQVLSGKNKEIEGGNMSNGPKVVLIIIMFTILMAGCAKNPPCFEEARIEMTLQDFKAQYPQAQKLADAKGTKGIPFSIYQREPKNKIKRAHYFFSENKLVGIIVIFSEGAQFDSIVDELGVANGEPTKQFMMAGSKAAVWEKGEYFINMLQGTTETEIKLPTGITQVLNPGDIVIMLGRKNE